jgi:molybdate transport system ATP-binding protein
MTLDATIRTQLGSLSLSLDIAAERGETIALLGPNGAGKTTALRCLAGLHPIDDGRIRLDGNALDDPDRDVFVPAAERSVGVVFQDYLLFANLSALDNVAFGLRARGMARRTANQQAGAWIDRVDLADHSGHRPRALSGGQQQRVALARALATEPALLLLDEPLAALDAATRIELRRLLRRHLSTFAGVCILVTHDPIDAHALADRVVVIESGAVTQTGALADLTSHPRSRYIADLAGTNLVTGTITGSTLVLANGTPVTVGNSPGDGPACAVIAPRTISLFRSPPGGSPRNAWAVSVVDVDRIDDRVRVRLDGPIDLVAEITAAAAVALDLVPGVIVWAAAKASEIVAEPT